MRNTFRFGFLAAYCCWVAYGLGPLRKYLEVPYQHLDVRSELKRIYIDANDATCTQAELCISYFQGARINPRCKDGVIMRGNPIMYRDGVLDLSGWGFDGGACPEQHLKALIWIE